MSNFVINENTLISYSGEEEIINIPYGIVKISKGAFTGNKRIKKVIISDSVTEVGYRAFSDCTALEEVIFPLRKMRISDACFNKCVSLKNITLPLLTSIAPAMFRECKSLKEITLPGTVRRICMNAFKKCLALEHISIPASVVDVSSYVFSECHHLKTLVIQGEKCPLKCNSITHCRPEVIMGNSMSYRQEAENGWVIDEAGVLWKYVGCSAHIEIPSSVRKISDYAFCSHELIETVYIPSTVQSIGHHVFAHCTSLKKAIIEEGVEYINTCLFWDAANWNRLCFLILLHIWEIMQ